MKIRDIVTLVDGKTPKRRASRKYKKKVKKPWVLRPCPFCGVELLEQGEGMWSRERKTECECGAIEVPICPACRHSTWYSDGEYRHSGSYNCGFRGKKGA